MPGPQVTFTDNVLGDANLWWGIAEASALALGRYIQLAVGRILTVSSVPSNAKMQDLWDVEPRKANGSPDPVLPVPAAAQAVSLSRVLGVSWLSIRRTTRRRSAYRKLPSTWDCPCAASSGLWRDRVF